MMMSMLACAWSFEALNAASVVSAEVRSKKPEHDVSCNGFPLCVSDLQTSNASRWLCAEVRSKEPEDDNGCHVVVCVCFSSMLK